MKKKIGGKLTDFYVSKVVQRYRAQQFLERLKKQGLRKTRMSKNVIEFKPKK